MGFLRYLGDMLVLVFLTGIGLLLIFSEIFVFLLDKNNGRQTSIGDILLMFVGIVCVIGAMWIKRKWNM